MIPSLNCLALVKKVNVLVFVHVVGKLLHELLYRVQYNVYAIFKND